MAVTSVLSIIGKDIKKVFSWLGSPKGQAIIGAGEAVVETIFPLATGIINIANVWLAKIIQVEALAAGAASQDGTGVLKATIVMGELTPVILAFAQTHGLPVPTADKIAAANTALVAFLNALEAKS